MPSPLWKYICFLLLVSFNLCWAQNITPVPKWVELESIASVGEVDIKSVEDGYYYVLIDEQVNTNLFQRYFHFGTKIISESGLDQASQIELDYDPSYQKIQIHFIKIHRGNQVIDRTKSAGFRILNEENNRSNGILDGRNTLYANLTDIRTGDLIEYAYSILGHNPIFKQYFSYTFSLGYSVPVGRVKRRLIASKDTELSIKYFNWDEKPVVSPGDEKIYYWLVNNPTPYVSEDNTPDWFFQYPHVQVSNFKDWHEVKKWLNGVFSNGQYDQFSLRRLTDSIQSIYPGEIEKQVTALVDFSQNQIRYSGNENGIYGHKPHLPNEVLTNRYGDCKDKSFLLHELLKQINVASYPTLLNTSLGKTLKQENPSTGVFDHCILAIDFRDTLYYIDPTITFQKGNFKKRSVPDYGCVFLLGGQDSLFKDIPPDQTNKIDITEVFDVDEDGNAILTVETAYSGSDADEQRRHFAANSITGIQEQYRSYYLKNADFVEVTQPLYVSDVEDGVFRVSEHYKLDKFWVRSDSSDGRIRKEFAPYELNRKITYVQGALRKYPLAIQFPIHIHQKIIINKVIRWDIPDKSFREDNKFFTYTFDTRVSKNKLVLEYAFKTKTNTVDPVDYLFYKNRTDLVGENMLMTLETGGSSEQITAVDGKIWIILITVSLIAIAICLGIYFYFFRSRNIRAPEVTDYTGRILTDWEIFSKIWGKPRTVFRYLVDRKINHHLAVLLVLGGMVNSLDRASWYNWGDKFSAGLLWSYIAGGTLFGWIGSVIYAALINWTGKWLNGQGHFKDILRTLAYAMLPSIVSLIFILPQIAIAGNELFKDDGDLTGGDITTGVIVYGCKFVEFVLSIWTIVFFIIGVSEVQQLNKRNAVLNLILPVILILTPFLLIYVLFN